MGGLSFPDYYGSNHQQNYVLPVPYFEYVGKRLKVDREGGRFYLYQGKHYWLDLSTSVGYPADSSQDIARLGMPNINPVLAIGPRVVFELYNNADDSLRIRAALPLRGAIATDFNTTQYIGAIFSPFLQVRYYTGWETALSIGPYYATESYNDYYYQVDPQYATATRSSYDAKAGYDGFRFTLTTSHHFKHHYYLAGLARYDILSGATFSNSPLVKQNSSLSLAVELSYIFEDSDN